MMRRVTISMLGMAILTEGCVPLEQAPLVYSSKNQFGVGVAAGTPDSPGLDVNIGYKGLDAAFVPVAVAKRCPKAGCSAADYNILVVRGTNKRTGQMQSDNNEIRRLQDKIAAADTRGQTADKHIERDTNVLAGLATLDTKEKRLTALNGIVSTPPAADGTPAPTLSPTEIAEKAELERVISELKKVQANESDIKKDLAKQTSALADSTTEKVSAKAELDRLLARKDSRNDDDKFDAYSVYGSFNGGASGDAKGAGLKLGKVFSTGIAAQNVSQGIRSSARIEAMAKCLAAAKTLVAGSTSDSVIGAAIASCREPEPVDVQ